MLGQCPALAHLILSRNEIGPDGTESLAGVLGQCASLAHLDLWNNGIEAVGKGRLRASWCGRTSLSSFMDTLHCLLVDKMFSRQAKHHANNKVRCRKRVCSAQYKKNAFTQTRISRHLCKVPGRNKPGGQKIVCVGKFHEAFVLTCRTTEYYQPAVNANVYCHYPPRVVPSCYARALRIAPVLVPFYLLILLSSVVPSAPRRAHFFLFAILFPWMPVLVPVTRAIRPIDQGL